MNSLEKIGLPLHQNPSGDKLFLNIFTIRGNKTGEHVHFQANVHGAELQGNAVIYELMKTFLNEEFSGSATFIPQANPLGLNQKSGTHTNGRFHAVTGNNFNRYYLDIVKNAELLQFNLEKFVNDNGALAPYQFRVQYKTALEQAIAQYILSTQNYGLPYEKKLALILQKTAAKADYVFDLHTGPSACRYVYCGEFMRHQVVDLNFPHHLIIPNEFAGAMDEACFMPWFTLNKLLKEKNKAEMPFESYTLELGSEETLNLSAAKQDSANILHFLSKRGFFTKEKTTELLDKQYFCQLKDYKTYYSPYGGQIDYLKKPGDIIAKGEAIATLLNFNELGTGCEHHDLLKNISAEKDCLLINHSPSANVMEGAELFQVMENVQCNF